MSLSLSSLHAHNRVEGTGVICVEKVDLIACDARKEALFFRRAWRAIRPSLIPAWGAIMMGGLSSQNTQRAICIQKQDVEFVHRKKLT